LIKLDYTLKTVEERVALVNKFLEENPNPSPTYLESLADYIVLFAAQQEAKEARARQRTILTENRNATIQKRETSFEGLAAQFENGEDGVYNIMTEDKNVIFRPKLQITKKDLERIPELRQVREAIQLWKRILADASGKDAYIAKAAIIELSRDQYIIKDAYLKPCEFTTVTPGKVSPKLDGDIAVGALYHC
jgi:hypothetical protein